VLNQESQIKIERLNQLSQSNALDPDTYIPWDLKIEDSLVIMPNHLFSLYETDLISTLSINQIRELQKWELSQVMSVYAWSESMACLVFNEMLFEHMPNSEIGKYLVNMSIEEYRHQKMFTRIVDNIGVGSRRYSKFHYWTAKFYTKAFSTQTKFVAILAIEQVSDMYGRHLRRDSKVSEILHKACELHSIEEGRHMAFQKICIDQFITKKSIATRSILSVYMALTIWFMRTQYIKLCFFEEVGLPNPKLYHRIAQKNYRRLFGEYCVADSMQYANSIGLMNGFTRFFWKIILKAKI